MTEQMEELSASNIEIYNPLQNLFARYKKDRAEVESVAASIDGNHTALEYFFSACRVQQKRHSASISAVFDLKPAIKAIDSFYWAQAMAMTDVMEYMAADKRNAWNEQIHEHKAPEFTFETVSATLLDMLSSREKLLAERVDGLFRQLSGSHVTNSPSAFGKRFIIGYMRSYGSLRYEKANYIHDLRCVIGKFMGRNDMQARTSYHDIDVPLDGKWYSFDGGSWKIRMYKCGTAHMEVHPDMAWRLNKILAFLYPMAIPAEFRTKPKKMPKGQELSFQLVSMKELDELESGLPYRDNEAKRLSWFAKEPPSAGTVSIMESLGGVRTMPHEWMFDYPIKPVIKELQRTGCIPEQKSHQFYPTPEVVAQAAIAMLGIEDGDNFLEPEAGQGGLAKYLPADRTTCVEISELHCAMLSTWGFKQVVRADFLAWSGGKFSAILMNPPFSGKQAEAHVKHAASMLAGNFRLVAVMPASYKGKTVLAGMRHQWSDVYSNEFAGTSVSVVILKLTKGESK
jgi:hypothetical protein